MADSTSGNAVFQWAALAIAPICTLAIGWFSATQQARLAEKVEKALDERMRALDQKIDLVNGSLGKNVTDLKTDLTKSIDNLREDVGDVRNDIKSLSATTITVNTTLQNLIGYLEKLIKIEVKSALSDERSRSHGASGD
ncbi:MAG: hypothetical protein JO051_15975 [Acidobacteriaceae bacterium]|nr:hypothetical protein [Acidobacteriaceae bacterium]